MSYQDRFGITAIRNTNINSLEISYDWDEDPDSIYPVLLFTPDQEYPDNHSHIPLSRKQAHRLYEWLDEYLSDSRQR